MLSFQGKARRTNGQSWSPPEFKEVRQVPAALCYHPTTMDALTQAQSARNWLERLGQKIPGYAGFADRELRRDVDRQLREHLSKEVARLRDRVREKIAEFVDGGKIGELQSFDRLDKGLDGLSQAIRFADYGASGLFDAVKIGEAELGRIYEFDLSIVTDLADLELAITALPGPGSGDPRAAVDALRASLGALQEKWAGRERVISSVVG